MNEKILTVMGRISAIDTKIKVLFLMLMFAIFLSSIFPVFSGMFIGVATFVFYPEPYKKETFKRWGIKVFTAMMSIILFIKFLNESEHVFSRIEILILFLSTFLPVIVGRVIYKHWENKNINYELFEKESNLTRKEQAKRIALIFIAGLITFATLFLVIEKNKLSVKISEALSEAISTAGEGDISGVYSKCLIGNTVLKKDDLSNDNIVSASCYSVYKLKFHLKGNKEEEGYFLIKKNLSMGKEDIDSVLQTQDLVNRLNSEKMTLSPDEFSPIKKADYVFYANWMKIKETFFMLANYLVFLYLLYILRFSVKLYRFVVSEREDSLSHVVSKKEVMSLAAFSYISLFASYILYLF